METPPLPPDIDLKQPPVVTAKTPSTYTIHIEEKSKYDWVAVVIDTTDGAKPVNRTVMCKSPTDLLANILICVALRDADRKHGGVEIDESLNGASPATSSAVN